MMTSEEIRQRFIDYFNRQAHTTVASSSLIPENDPTLLFANAGMNQFKNTFLGLEKRAYTRAVSSQKCVRAGGKHNDLENVGFTARHHTFFEMLGNFSFGDYFKKDAIRFAWEFLTVELKIPKEKLYVTVFESDDEAADIWHNQEGIPRDRIFKFGEKDNFWRMGEVGPCGPCTEIFYDHGPKGGKESDPYKGIASGEDRFVEIWNLVFMQFYEKAPGVMEPLPKPSVDTGSGLERVTAALQGHLNNYDTDLFQGMIQKACEVAGVKYISDKEILEKDINASRTTAALRVLADHARSTAFLIADGALPSNEGRGYVLRRIMRRAIRYGRDLSPKTSLMPIMIQSLIEKMAPIYPELKNRSNIILSNVRDEEERFSSTLDQGTIILNDELKKLKSQGQKVLSGESIFKLYDTFGFPVDLTRLMAQEQGYKIDEPAFEAQMEQSKQKAKSSWKAQGLSTNEAHVIKLAQDILTSKGATTFTGYEKTQDDAKVIALSHGSSTVNELKAGEKGLFITDKTCFYGESGGQASDHGLVNFTGGHGQIIDCQKYSDVFVHYVEVQKGSLKLNSEVHLKVNDSKRRDTASNHSATHLLHAALKKVLGEHVTQAGSLVDESKLRFDFTHNRPLSTEESSQIEHLVNSEIARANPVETKVMGHKEAVASGAVALFGEKYGDKVRVLRMGDFSTELCGGTHVSNTSQIRVFKIVSEAGVSSGVRRIEGITGEPAIKYLLKNTQENLKARESVGLGENWQTYMGSNSEITTWIEARRQDIKNLERDIKKLKGGQVDLNTILNSASSFKHKDKAAKAVWAVLDIDDREVLSQTNDHLKNKIQTGIVVTIGKGDKAHPVIVSVTKDLNPDFSAGQILKEIGEGMSGKGGGRPDFAQGTVQDLSKEASTKDKVFSKFV